MGSRHQFRHEKLEVFAVARAFVSTTQAIIEGLPPGTGHFRDQFT